MAVPHLKVPFRIGNSGAAEIVEQGSIDEIAQCVQSVLLTTVGDRIEVPTYGVPQVVFSEVTGGWSTAALAAVDRWEPRARATITSTIDSIDDLTTFLNVSVAPVVSVQ